MASLFSAADSEKILKLAKSSQSQPTQKVKNASSMNAELQQISKSVASYFKDSDAILITSREQLHDYVTELIHADICGIDTETTGLDRYYDHIVGTCLYYPGGVEAYIPSKHVVPVFDTLYKDQVSYEDVGAELSRIRDAKVKQIYANADFDLAFIYKDFGVDFCDNFYYDVILAWRCLKENEPHNGLKELYNKYVLKGKGDPKKFSDFFSPSLFPYCNPNIAKLYAANDAKITYDLYEWQLPYTLSDHPKCKAKHLEKISDLIWNLEFPLVRSCQMLHRNGVYFDSDVSKKVKSKYDNKYQEELSKLQSQVQDVIDKNISYTGKLAFRSGKEFNPDSPLHVKQLLYGLMGLQEPSKGGTGKEILTEFNNPITKQILKVRSISTLIGTFTDKLPNEVRPDGKIHAQFSSTGASTGRFSSHSPNLQNIPSHATDIRHVFRATPGYVMLSSDYSAQEPRLTSFVSGDKLMQQAFIDGRDVYATIASVSYGVPYEKCLEFHPETGEYQPEGKRLRGEAKFILLGICYGRSVPSIAEQLYGDRDDMTDEQKTKEAQKVFDSVMNSFPGLRDLTFSAEKFAKENGYVETILGRRRHIPDMQLPEFEFKAMPGYINPDIDPLNPTSLQNKEDIPERIVQSLKQEFSQYKYYGQIAKRTKELYEEKIRVINNRRKISDASRKCVNSIIQGSAAEQTKLAILRLEHDEEWNRIGGRLLIPVHDELIAEVPLQYYKEGGEILSRCMVEAASFLPFPSKCDVETTINWYGLEYPCQYTKPEKLGNNTEDEIKWIQYHLFESEYPIPIIPNEDGSDLKGDAAKGVNGKTSDVYYQSIQDYMKYYNISDSEFIDHIEKRVLYGSDKQYWK